MAGRRSVAPGLTKTQQLRQAKSAAMMREYQQKETKAPEETRRRALPKRGPPPADPKRVDFQRPGLTKAMLARMKHAEKFREDLERKHQETAPRRPRRTPAPIGGDARLGREKSCCRRGASPRRVSPSTRSTAPSRGTSPRRGPSAASRTSRKRSPEPIPEKSFELAREMNAELVQAEMIGEGPVENILIPPGVVSDEHPIIVSLPPAAYAPATAAAASSIANRSIQVLSETLNQQDAVEAAAVQNKLEELQLARREFVIAVANVGGNAVNIEDVVEPTYLPTSTRLSMVSPRASSSPPKVIYKIPDLDDEMFRVNYGLDHPDVVAAREFARRGLATVRQPDDGIRRLDDEFERILRQPMDDIMDISMDEIPDSELMPDEENGWQACREFNPEDLERFFDLERYPPSPRSSALPPPGRENLHPDLWELEDPWCGPCMQDNHPDLIEFDLMNFS